MAVAVSTERLHSEVLAALDTIHDPCSVAQGSAMGLAEMGLVRSVEVSEDGDVAIELGLDSPFCEMLGFMRRAAIEKISALDGAGEITITTDAGLDWTPARMSPAAQQRRRRRLEQLKGRL